MSPSPDLIPWCYGSLFALGLVYLGATRLLGSLGRSINRSLNNVGLRWIAGEGTLIGLFAAFLVGFGAVGLGVAWLGGSFLLGIVLATVFGFLVGGVYVVVVTLLDESELDPVVSEPALIGLTAHVIGETPPGAVGEGVLVVQGQRHRFPIRELNGESLQPEDLVTVVRLEEGALYVRKEPRG